MSKTTKRVLSMVLSVLMVLSMTTVFAIADTVEAFSSAYDGTVISKSALLVDTTITADQVSSNAQIQRTWDGKAYLFTAGVNAFNSVANAYAYAAAQSIASPDIIVLSAEANMTVDTNSRVFSPAWNTVPMLEMGDMTKVGAQSDGEDWTPNADYDAKTVTVTNLHIDGDIAGDVSVYGFTVTAAIYWAGRSGYGKGARAVGASPVNLQIVNTKISTNTATPFNAWPQDANATDTVLLKNLYYAKLHSRAFYDGAFPANITIDGMYIDFDKIPNPKSNKNVFMKFYSTKSTSATIKNSNMRGKMKLNTDPYHHTSADTWAIAGYAYGGTLDLAVNIENNTLTYYDAQGFAMVNYTDGTSNSTHPAMSSTAKGGITSYSFNGNYCDAYTGNMGALINRNFPSATKVEAVGNKVVGFTGTKVFNTSNTYTANNNYVSVGKNSVGIPAGNPYYLDYEMTTLSTASVDYANFSDVLEAGLTVRGVTFTKADTAVYLPMAATFTEGSNQVAYLDFAGTTYKFVVDNVNVFANNTTSLSALSAFAGKKIILPAGGYGIINVSFAADFYGSNFGINPNDKSGATPANKFDWKFNANWDKANATIISRFEILAGVSGNVKLDGVIFSRYDDDNRALTNGNLYAEVKNSVMKNAGMDVANGAFFTSNKRTMNYSDTSVVNNDSLLIQNIYVESVNPSLNHLIYEFNVPNLTIDGLYLDGTKAGMRRPAISWFKSTTLNKSTIVIKNSNLRNGGTSNATTNLFTFSGAYNGSIYTVEDNMSVEIKDNIIVNGENSANAIFTANISSVSSYVVTGNTVITTTGEKLFSTANHGGATDANSPLIGNVVFDSNRFVGFTSGNMLLDSKWGTLSNTYYSSTLAGLEDGDAVTGEYIAAMGDNDYYDDFNMNKKAGQAPTFVGNYVNSTISDKALLVDTTISDTDVANNAAITRTWDDTLYEFTVGTNAFKTLEDAFAKATELGYECPDIIVTSYDLSNGVGGETSPAVANQDLNITMPCNIYGRKWNIAPMNEMTDDFNAIESENKDWTLNTDFVSTVSEIVPDDVTSANHVYVSSEVSGNVKIVGFRVLDTFHFGGLNGQTKRTDASGQINITVENTLLMNKPGKEHWGGAPIDAFYATGGNAGIENEDSLTFKNVWFKPTGRNTELFATEVVPSTFVVDGCYMDMGYDRENSTHTFVKGNGKNVSHIYKNSYFAITSDKVCFSMAAGVTGIALEDTESVTAIFDNNVFNNYNDAGTTYMLDVNPGNYTTFEFTNNFVYNTEDTNKALFHGRSAFDEGVEVSNNVILGFAAADTLSSASKTAPITAENNFVVTKVCNSLDAYKAEVGTGLKTNATFNGAQTYYYDYDREYINIAVTGIDATVTDAIVGANEITFSVTEVSQTVTANDFLTTATTLPVVKTLATDADFENVIESVDLATVEDTLYLKVAYDGTSYGIVYEVNVTVTHTISKVNGQAPTKEQTGWKDYYQCDNCGDCFEDAEGNTSIADIDAWKTGAGKVEYKAVVNESTDVKYAYIEDALENAQPGDTIKLVDDAEATYITVDEGITLDLNGYKLTAEYVTAFEGSDIVDNNVTEDSGLYVEDTHFQISESNSQLPIYDSVNGCYIFTSVDLSYTYYEDSHYYFGPETADFGTVAGERVNALLRENSADTGVEIIVHINWQTDDYYSTQDFIYKPNYVEEYFSMAYDAKDYEEVYFYAKFTGDVLKQADKITVTTIVKSDRGTEFVSEATEFSLKNN